MSLQKPFWSMHAHSRYSANDALPAVADMVERAVELGYPALGLTDHGNVSGVVQLYKACRKAGIEPLPGIELYVTDDRERRLQSNNHLTVVSRTTQGYRNLVKLSNRAADNFFYKPRIDFADMVEMRNDDLTTGLVVGTGCYFGAVIQTLIHRGEQECKQVVRHLARCFPEVYVELQAHDVEQEGMSEDDIAEALVSIADELGLPYIVANDSHYVDEEDKGCHEALKTLVSFSSDTSEAVFPGSGYYMVERDWFTSRLRKKVLETALDNLADLASRAQVRLPELESFSMKVPDVSLTGDPYAEMEKRVWNAHGLNTYKDHAAREQRVHDELDVIKRSGFAGYLLLVAKVCDFMRDEDIWFHTRGSASGSYICWLLGITQVDPIVWGLRMDRFMSADRTRPPDIDLDVEHERRDEVVVWLADQFEVVQVGSHMQYSLTDQDEEGESKGSLKARYYSTLKKQGGPMHAWTDLPAKDWMMLKDISNRRLISGNGTHAAGYIIAPDASQVAELPLVWMASRGAYVTAYGKKDVEALGFVKLDLLGLRTLTAIKHACKAMGWTRQDYEAIPEKDVDVFKRLAKGQTDGIFQLEGATMARGMRDLKPRNLSEIVAAQALYRPAVLGSGGDKSYIARRGRKEAVPERHPDVMGVCKETYGILLYQEQIISLLRGAGMPAEELTDTLDAVKASNEGTAAARRFLDRTAPRIIQLLTDRGWPPMDVEWFMEQLPGYAEYSFNKAHAASYGIVAWRTAYLVQYYPLEYWCALLQSYDEPAHAKKQARYISAARKDNVSVLMAMVNKSGVSYTVDRKRKSIRKGLQSIKHVGPVSAKELVDKGPFTSMKDLSEKVLPSRVSGVRDLIKGVEPSECGGTITHLYNYGALGDVIDNEEI